MSLADELRFLRAVSGGLNPAEIAQAVDETPQNILRAERRYSRLNDPELIEKLADYYDRDLDKLQWHNERARDYLTRYLKHHARHDEPVTLMMRNGAEINGRVAWWSLASIGVQQVDGSLIVVQRHAVIDWPGDTGWRYYNAQEDSWTPPGEPVG